MRNKLKFGDSADDGTGDLLREGAFNIEHALCEIYFFLSGGASEVKLPEALPEERGGTSASTVDAYVKALVKRGSSEFALSAINGVPCVLITLAANSSNVFVMEGTVKPLVVRMSPTEFHISGHNDLTIDISSVVVPKDINGNPLVALHLDYDWTTNKHVITTHPVKYDQGKVIPLLDSRAELPVYTSIKLVMVRRKAP